MRTPPVGLRLAGRRQVLQPGQHAVRHGQEGGVRHQPAGPTYPLAQQNQQMSADLWPPVEQGEERGTLNVEAVVGSAAVPVAVRVPPSMKAISPMISPGSMR